MSNKCEACRTFEGLSLTGNQNTQLYSEVWRYRRALVYNRFM